MLYSMRLHEGLEQDGKSKSKDKKAPVGALSRLWKRSSFNAFINCGMRSIR